MIHGHELLAGVAGNVVRIDLTTREAAPLLPWTCDPLCSLVICA